MEGEGKGKAREENERGRKSGDGKGGNGREERAAHTAKIKRLSIKYDHTTFVTLSG